MGTTLHFGGTGAVGCTTGASADGSKPPDSCRVDPSMSVNRNVIVPVGSSAGWESVSSKDDAFPAIVGCGRAIWKGRFKMQQPEPPGERVVH